MSLTRGIQVRISTEIDPLLIERLRPREKPRPTVVELRTPAGERMLRSEAWVSLLEADGGALEVVICMGPPPKREAIGVLTAFRDAAKLSQRDARILQLVSEGTSQNAVATQLGLTRYVVNGVVRKHRLALERG